MTEEEKLRLFNNFMSNGMDISPFGFIEDYDKENLFTMVQEYTTAMTDKEVDVRFDSNKDITVYLDNRFICSFYTDSEYKTLMVDSDLPATDEDLQLCLTMLFLTIKELSAMISALSEAFSKATNKESKYIETKPDKKFVSTTKLPKNIMNNIEKIRDLQKSILSENQKYKIKKKIKEDK